MEQQVGILRAQLARKTGCNLETIRYYEKVGLLPGSCPSMWCKFGCGQRAAFSGGLGCNL